MYTLERATPKEKYLHYVLECEVFKGNEIDFSWDKRNEKSKQLITSNVLICTMIVFRENLITIEMLVWDVEQDCAFQIKRKMNSEWS